MVASLSGREFNFDMIRPSSKEEIYPAILRIAEAPEFYACMNWLFPELSTEEVKNKITSIRTTYEFQRDFMHVGIRKIVEKTSDGLSCSGFDYVDNDNSYLYISNHRDIFLDSGLLQILLFEREIDTTQITFGDNLMQGVFVDVGKVNKMFTVYRGGSRREIYENSLRLSAYIRTAVTEIKDSVWVAQRSGRTKDGIDATHTGVLKMFAQSGGKDFVECFKELNLAPMSVSYEYDPCDYYKAQEFHLTEAHGKYDKQPNEDLNSVIKGVIDYKGRIHMAIAEPIQVEELEAIDNFGETPNDKIKILCDLIDQRIYDNFKLWPTHFIGYDLLNNSTQYTDHYSREEKEKFEKIMTERLSEMRGVQSELKRFYLNIYANPLGVLSERSTFEFKTKPITKT